MELTNFLEFEPFNQMRECMGTDQLGQFELFDPDRHLTGEERSVLARHGLLLPRSSLGRLLDYCLCYKNSRWLSLTMMSCTWRIAINFPTVTNTGWEPVPMLLKGLRKYARPACRFSITRV